MNEQMSISVFLTRQLNSSSTNTGAMTVSAASKFIYGWLRFVITGGGSRERLGRTVIFRPIKSGIIRQPVGLPVSGAKTKTDSGLKKSGRAGTLIRGGLSTNKARVHLQGLKRGHFVLKGLLNSLQTNCYA